MDCANLSKKEKVIGIRRKKNGEMGQETVYTGLSAAAGAEAAGSSGADAGI